MTKKNHHYLLYVIDLPDNTTINGKRLRHVKKLKKIFEKDSKAVIQVIWPNVENNNIKKRVSARRSES